MTGLRTAPMIVIELLCRTIVSGQQAVGALSALFPNNRQWCESTLSAK
jgi:hypothetical protein